MRSDLISVADRRLMRRLTAILGFLVLFVFAYSRLELLYGDKFYDVASTGNGEWIWMRLRIAAGDPAAFYATRDFDLPAGRQFTSIKVLGDPEYTLYFNGQQIGGRRAGDESVLDTYDVSKLARDRGNRVVVAVRSANGVGGLIVSIDLSQDFRNYIVTDRSWHIVPRWSPDILVRDGSVVSRPMSLGKPPARRWNYLTRRPGALYMPPAATLAPQASFTFHTALAAIEIKEGVAVTVAKPVTATAFDFGSGATGHLQLTPYLPSNGAEVIRVRFASERSELDDVEGGITELTLIPGEPAVIDPQSRVFRYAAVYGSSARAVLLQ